MCDYKVDLQWQSPELFLHSPIFNSVSFRPACPISLPPLPYSPVILATSPVVSPSPIPSHLLCLPSSPHSLCLQASALSPLPLHLRLFTLSSLTISPSTFLSRDTPVSLHVSVSPIPFSPISLFPSPFSANCPIELPPHSLSETAIPRPSLSPPQ